MKSPLTSLQTPKSGESLTVDYLLELDEGSIIFTENAMQSWNTSGKPEIFSMQTSLIRLAGAALEWRESNASVGVTLDKWLQQKLGKLVPMQDRMLEKLKLDEFIFEGLSFSITPHIKVKDATDPSHVARIYFAIDSQNK